MVDRISSRMSRVCVLGHRGMLGHVVARFLEESGFEVLTLSERYCDGPHADRFVDSINDLEVDWCVNCIGVRAGDEISDDCVDRINHQLPALCSSRLRTDCGLIHASSDGVFSPSAGPCDWDRTPDAEDVYGISKRRAERALTRENDLIIRCSIIGPELGLPRSLFGWLANQKGSVDGYSNHCWNGITSLQWAKECVELIRFQRAKGRRIVQPASNPVVTKGELLGQLCEKWAYSLEVCLIKGPVSVTRHLVSNTKARPLATLLAELKAWY
ncbi:sugar nucleotide-binding protein [bacterium]|jgi:dTDP-4-dehydrorhamnose reductase|nr:sugar nucleotide-binding protein [bacterium]MDB4746124.1 sugar nucleotide-binding protein [Verrucomicrobiota bacterium]